MINVIELLTKLKYLRALAENSNRLYLTNREGSLELKFANDFLKSITSVESDSEEEFSACIKFKDLFEVLKNSVSDFVEVFLKDGDLYIKLRNGEAVFEPQRLFFQPDEFPTIKEDDLIFTLPVKEFKNLLQVFLKLNTGRDALIIDAKEDLVEFRLSSDSYMMKQYADIEKPTTVALSFEAIDMIYKAIRNMKGEIKLYTDGETVNLTTDTMKLSTENINEIQPSRVPERMYHFNVVKDDVLEAFEIISKITNLSVLEFSGDNLSIHGDNGTTFYKNKVLIDSNIPAGTMLELDSNKMLDVIKSLESDYIDFEITEDLQHVVIDNNNKLIIVGVM